MTAFQVPDSAHSPHWSGYVPGYNGTAILNLVCRLLSIGVNSAMCKSFFYIEKDMVSFNILSDVHSFLVSAITRSKYIGREHWFTYHLN